MQKEMFHSKFWECRIIYNYLNESTHIEVMIVSTIACRRWRFVFSTTEVTATTATTTAIATSRYTADEERRLK